MRCSACRVTYDDLSWGSLALFERLEPPKLEQLILEWPNDTCVEVRVCRCGRPIAAKRPLA